MPKTAHDDGLRDLLDHLPTDIRLWFDAQVPENGSRADLVRAIIVDAYNEEMDDAT